MKLTKEDIQGIKDWKLHSINREQMDALCDLALSALTPKESGVEGRPEFWEEKDMAAISTGWYARETIAHIYALQAYATRLENERADLLTERMSNSWLKQPVSGNLSDGEIDEIERFLRSGPDHCPDHKESLKLCAQAKQANHTGAGNEALPLGIELHAALTNVLKDLQRQPLPAWIGQYSFETLVREHAKVQPIPPQGDQAALEKCQIDHDEQVELRYAAECKLEKAVEVLEEQKNGAEWRRDNEPENWNGADDEAFERLEAILAALATPAPSKEKTE